MYFAVIKRRVFYYELIATVGGECLAWGDMSGHWNTHDANVTGDRLKDALTSREQRARGFCLLGIGKIGLLRDLFVYCICWSRKRNQAGVAAQRRQ